MYRTRPLPLKDITINSRFWNRYISLVRDQVIPYQWEALNDRLPGAAASQCIKNFEIAAGLCTGNFYGMVFQDSDLYKWLESVSYCLAAFPDPALEKLADDAIDLIGAAQWSDGYINTYFTVKEPKGRYKNLREGHELYCAGHLIEAAVAHYNATGKRNFLTIATRFADRIDADFGPGDGQIKGYPGHQIIELALFKLYKVTAETRYLTLAEHFIRQRGTDPKYFDVEFAEPDYRIIFPELIPGEGEYAQSHIRPVEQRQAVGHAVRAVYMYSAMVDLAAELNDAPLREACEALYRDVEKQTYITGAIGAASQGERFTTAYDLPNDTVYGETCASVGLMMFCQRMNALTAEARYADMVERALYNTVLAGMSLTGTEFFYVNPLESDPRVIACNPTYKHVKPVRQRWFDCSCCPTNIARTVMNLGSYVYAASDEGLLINLYCAGSAKDGDRRITVETDYPYDGEVNITVNSGRFTLTLRDPEYAPVRLLTVNGQSREIHKANGYMILDPVKQGDQIKLSLDMSPKQVYCAVNVQKNIGKAAVMRGPLVYCSEGADNDTPLGAYALQTDALFKEQTGFINDLPDETVALTLTAYRYANTSERMYSTHPPDINAAELTLIPYHLWANRGENEMRVFFNTVRAGKGEAQA